MSKDLSGKLVVAIASRALFDLDASNEIYEKQGIKAYAKYQIEHEQEPLSPGIAFSLVKKLLNLNQFGPLVEVILISRNSADTGLRIFNSIAHYNLDITRAAFTNGEIPYPYALSFGTHLFLSANPEDVKGALKQNLAAATIINQQVANNDNEQLRIAFDGDAVLFSNEAEHIYQEQGLEAFTSSEKQAANKPLAAGPFKWFLAALHKIQSNFPKDNCPIRTALITARQAPAHERVVRTLRSWNIRIDEALFLGGLDKAEFLKTFMADIFFDDHKDYCTNASQHVTTGHVPNDIRN